MSDQRTSRPLVRFLCLPDVDRPIGGVKQLYRHVEHLLSLGWNAAILTDSNGFRPSWFESSAPSLSLSESHCLGELDPRNSILVFPETYLSADLSDFRGLDLSAFCRVVFNQNAYYTYGSFDSETANSVNRFYRDSSVLQVLSVSEDTNNFLSRNLGIPDDRMSRIVNAIESIFYPDLVKSDRFHWMPRKNSDHVQAVLHGLQSCRFQHNRPWQGEPLQNLSHFDISQKLNSSRLYLSFGYPEGFGLPLAEAMAAGCWVVGYSGGGGRELFGFGASEEVMFGDWAGFVGAIQRAIDRFSSQPRDTSQRLLRQSLAIRTLYSSSQERESIKTAWTRIESNFYKYIPY